MPLVFASGGDKKDLQKKSGSDTWNSLKIGAEQLVSSLPALADIPTALVTGRTPATDLTEYIGEKTGLQPGRWAKEDEQNYSQKYQQQRGNVDESWQGVDSDNGLLNEAWSVIKNTPELAAAYAKNPQYTLQQVVQSLPGMVAGGMAGRGLMAVGRGAAMVRGAMGPELPGVLERAVGSRWASPLASGAGEGGVAAASNFDQTDRTAPDYDPRRAAAAALGAGAVDLLIGAAGGRVAQRFGLETPETLIAGGRRVPNFVRNEAGEVLLDRSGREVMQGRPLWQRVLGGAAAEGGVQEFPQSMSEGGFQNLGEGRAFTDSGPDGQSILRQGVEGAMAGGLMGAGANVMGRGRTGPTDLLTRQQFDTQNAPPPPAAPLRLPAPVMTGTQGGDLVIGDPRAPGTFSNPQADQFNRDYDEGNAQNAQVRANDLDTQRASGVPGAAAMFDPARGGLPLPQNVGDAYALLKMVVADEKMVPVDQAGLPTALYPAFQRAVEILQQAGVKPPTAPAAAAPGEKSVTKKAATAEARNSTKNQLQSLLDQHLQDGVISPAQHVEDTALLTENKLGKVQTRMKKYAADIALAAETAATVSPPQLGVGNESNSQSNVQNAGGQGTQTSNATVRQAVKSDNASVQGSKPGSAQTQKAVHPEVTAVHDLADQKGLKWDNDPTFMALSTAVTGETHLDKMTAPQLNQVKEYLNGLPDKNPTEPVPEEQIGDDTHREAARMFDAGDSYRQIAEALGSSHQGWKNTLIKYGRKHADRVAAATAENIGTGEAATAPAENAIAVAQSENAGSAGANPVTGDEVVDHSLEAGGVQNRASPDSGAAVVATTDAQALKEIESRVGKFNKGRVAIVTNALKKLGRKYTDLNPQQKLVLLETGHDITTKDVAVADALATALKKPTERPSETKAKAEKENQRLAAVQKLAEDLIPKVFQGDTDARDELLALFVNDPDGATIYKMVAAQYTSLTGRRLAGAVDFVQQLAAASQKAGTPSAPESASLTKGPVQESAPVLSDDLAKAVAELSNVNAALDALPAADKAQVAEHYDQDTFNGPAKKALVREYATWLRDQVWHPLEDVFKKLVKSVVTTAIAVVLAINVMVQNHINTDAVGAGVLASAVRSRKRGELFGSNARVKYKGAEGKIVGSKIDPLGYQQVKVETAAGTSDWVDANDVERPTYGAKDAVQKPGAAGVDVQQQTRNGQGVRSRYRKRPASASRGGQQEEPVPEGSGGSTGGKGPVGPTPSPQAEGEGFAERIGGTVGRQASVDVKHILKKAVGHLTFLHDIVNRIKAAVPAAKDFADAMDRKAANRIQREKDAEVIAVAAGKLDKDQYKNTNDFIGRSTFEQKWGYEPTWNKGVTVDPVLAAQWKKLGRAEQALADAIFKHGYDTIKEKQDLAKYFGVADSFTAFGQLKGPYAPLKRFGNYRAILKSKELLAAEKENNQKKLDELKRDPNHYLVQGFDTKGQAQVFADARAKDYAFTDAFEGDEKTEDRNTMNYEVLKKVMAVLDANNTMTKEARQAAIDSVNDLFVGSVEETSARMAGLKRKNRAGYDNDMVRSFLAGARADAVFMSNLIHGGDINKAFYEMKQQSKDATGHRVNQDDVNLMAQHYADSMRYVPTPWQDRITGLTAAWQLATSLGYHLTNATQTLMVALPQIAADFGDYTGAWRHVMEGYGVLKNAATGRTVDLTKITNPGLRTALQRAADLQLMDVGMDEDLSHFERTRTGYAAVDKTTGVAAAALHKLRQVSRMVELWNRVSTGTAAYNMARSHGKSDIQAQDYAIDILKSTQGDFSRTGAPLLIKKLPKPMVQYRKYQLMMAALYAKAFVQAFKGATSEERAVGRRMLAFKLTHTAVAAGTLGLPLMNLAGFLYAFGGGGDEPDWDLEKDLREAVGDKDLADLLLHGVPASVGFDLNAKLGDNQVFSILPYNNWDFSSKTAVAQTLGSLVGGPAVSQLGRFADGVALMGKGETYKGAEKLMPKGLEMAMQAFRVANDGFTMKNGDVIVQPEDINGFTTALTFIGMPTTEMRDIQRMQGLQYTTKKFFTDRSSEIEHDYARAFKEHDAEKMTELRDDWRTLQQSKDEWRDVFNDRPDFLKKQPITTLLRYPHTVQTREKKAQQSFAPSR